MVLVDPTVWFLWEISEMFCKVYVDAVLNEKSTKEIIEELILSLEWEETSKIYVHVSLPMI